MTTADDFKSLTGIQHVRHRPDMYIGSISCTKENRWVINDNNEAVQEVIETNPGLEQCVLELIVNAADHVERCKVSNETKVTKIEIIQADDFISVFNNGKGIPIEINKETNLYIPEMIFGNLMTSSNYDDSKKKTWGGKNGIGAKAANIFSTKFIVEVQSNNTNYYQEFTNGMNDKTDPVIKKNKHSDYTKITYYPDFAAFTMKSFVSNDTWKLLKKRAYDLSAATGKDVSVILNDIKIPVKDFSDYMNLYIGNAKKVVYSTNRWEVGFALCPYTEPVQISFVNAICTDDGGNHVKHVLEPVLDKITEELQAKHKNVVIKKQYIRDNVIIFIKALIDNPAFDSQLKRKLKTPISEFGSRCDVPDDIVKKIAKLGICDNVLEIAKAKDMNNALKKTDGTKTKRLNDIEKLDDANFAGDPKKSMQCTLILTEGDSAKSLALNGIMAAGGRDIWGVFPLRGKFLNVRGATATQLEKNEEIIAINRILGIKPGITDISKLRYGKVMIMTDSDTDGYHIKGLLINYFSVFFPELLEKGLLGCIITPIVKVFKGDTVVEQFYNLNDFEKWNEQNTGNYRIKYYKGLGTSDAKEAKEYFKNLAKNKINYLFDNGDDMESIVRTFDKTRASERKQWILNYLANKQEVDYNQKNISVKYFIDRELVQFSVYDGMRSIPNIIDGLKPSQRKILFGCLKKNLFKKADKSGEIKVAQLSGYISEVSGYHHGEESLQGTIVKMAQDFVGSGNINILEPKGNFGSRLMGGDDASSARYIFTYLRDIVKTIYNEHDNKLLNYIKSEGSSIEPEFYVPIIPMILVNGSVGIGTGWSTDIPCFNPIDLVDNIKRLMNNENIKPMDPYYRGFKGSIEKINDVSWNSIGNFKIVDKTVHVTELPIGMWTEVFKKHLNKLIEKEEIKSFSANGDTNEINFIIKLEQTLSEQDAIELLKLENKINATNLVAFDENQQIVKYGSVDDILWTFYTYRLNFYEKRRLFLIKTLEDDINLLTEKLRFINMVINDEIVVFKRKKAEIIVELEKHNFKNISELITMTIDKFTIDEIDKLKDKIEKLQIELNVLKSKTNKDLWTEDLDNLVQYL